MVMVFSIVKPPIRFSFCLFIYDKKRLHSHALEDIKKEHNHIKRRNYAQYINQPVPAKRRALHSRKKSSRIK